MSGVVSDIDGWQCRYLFRDCTVNCKVFKDLPFPEVFGMVRQLPWNVSLCFVLCLHVYM